MLFVKNVMYNDSLVTTLVVGSGFTDSLGVSCRARACLQLLYK